VYSAALLPERECAEMFGLTLSGHPNPKPEIRAAAIAIISQTQQLSARG
ncbi:MAG: NADH-quinone oxidoreductase subunit C, partial [Novosphingobium sp.]